MSRPTAGITIAERWVDDRWDYGQKRYISIGALSPTAVLVVVHTERGGKTRLISARKASLGGSCPLDCANGPTTVNPYDRWYYACTMHALYLFDVTRLFNGAGLARVLVQIY